jgi:hypothetical protein
LAEAPAAAERDLFLPLSTLVVQQLSFAPVQRWLEPLETDYHRSAAILQKFHIISQLRGSPGLKASLLALSELEYLLFLLRSQYDVLQRLLKEVAALVRDLTTGSKAIQDLPETFRGVVLEEEKPRSVDAIVSAYHMPRPLAEWYAAQTPSFAQLRYLRDGITHRGQDLPSVFPAPDGLAVDVREPPWAKTPVWEDAASKRGHLGSLRRLFSRFILTTHQACTRFAELMPTILRLPEPVHPDLRVYLRSPFGHWLVALPGIDAAPWEGPPGGEVL